MGSGKGSKKNTNVSKMPPGWKPPTQGVTSTIPSWTGGQGYTANANLPRPGSIRPSTPQQVQQSQQQGRYTPAVTGARQSGPLNFQVVPRQSGTQVKNFKATSQSSSRGIDGAMTGAVAGRPIGNTPVPQFEGSMPRFFPTQQIGSTSARDVSSSERWRTLLGLPQGVTLATNQMQYGSVPRENTISPYLGAYEKPKSRYAAGQRGDNSPEDRAILEQQMSGPFGTRFGDIRYTPPQTDWSQYSPSIGATGIFDDTLKSTGTATTTDLYNPKTLQGRRTAPATKKTIDYSDPYAAIENIRLNRGAPADNLSQSETIPDYEGGGYDDGYGGGGYGGGGGGGGYSPATRKWLQNMASWRI